MPICLTSGEAGGIAPELTLKAWQALHQDVSIPFYVIGDADWLCATAAHLNLNVPIVKIDDPSQTASVFCESLPVFHQPLPQPPVLGQSLPTFASAVIASIDTAVQQVRENKASAIVTSPIHKSTLYAAGFAFDGHTEYLAHLCGVPVRDAVMMLACPLLKVVPLTIHKPLAMVAELLSVEKVLHTARIVLRALQNDFGIVTPRLAVAGLNPHAGENGTIGREETTILQPAIAILQQEGWQVTGAHPADTLFHEDARITYDAVLCMYHDQALIPLKTLDFWGGVNCTLGLPIIRTSPDHGTGLSLAGRGTARPDSLIAAIHMAAQMTARRQCA